MMTIFVLDNKCIFNAVLINVNTVNNDKSHINKELLVIMIEYFAFNLFDIEILSKGI